MNKILTAILVTLGFITWFIGVVFLGVTTWLANLGYAIQHNPNIGNCWTYALPRWQKYGGYLLIRPSADIRFLWIFKIPHVAWIQHLPEDGLTVEQLHPSGERSRNKWLPWKAIWYHGKVHTKEIPKRPPNFDWHVNDERKG